MMAPVKRFGALSTTQKILTLLKVMFWKKLRKIYIIFLSHWRQFFLFFLQNVTLKKIRDFRILLSAPKQFTGAIICPTASRPTTLKIFACSGYPSTALYIFCIALGPLPAGLYIFYFSDFTPLQPHLLHCLHSVIHPLHCIVKLLHCSEDPPTPVHMFSLVKGTPKFIVHILSCSGYPQNALYISYLPQMYLVLF